MPAVIGLVFAAALTGAGEPPDESTGEPLATPENEAKKGSAEDLYYKGAAAYSASDYDSAIEHFTKALEIAGRQRLDPSVRAALLFNLGRAHRRAYDVDGDPTHLRKARDIHKRFLEEAELVGLEAPDQIAEAEEEIEAIDETLAQLEEEQTAGEDAAGPSPPTTTDAPDPKSGKRRTRGIALAVSGGVALAGGVGVAIYGTTFRRDALDAVALVEDPEDQEQEFVDAETRKGRIWIGVGAGVAAVGAGLLIWGIVDLASGRKAESKVSAAPWFGPGGSGLALTGRF